jgi:DNA-binding NtrC family response regulator
MKDGTILIVDDNEEILLALKILLGEHFKKTEAISDPERIPEYLSKTRYDVYILDMNFKSVAGTGNEGIFWMHKILEQDPEAAVIFITAYGDIDLAVKAVKEGATDFITKPWDDEKLLTTALNACQIAKSKRKIQDLKRKQKHLSESLEINQPGLIGNSGSIQEIKQTLQKVAPTDVDVLILGESGTGKEVLAREIHKFSNRCREIFVHVDLGAIPENLFESELFGHEKGAFTDAKESKPGRFEVASGGTLFLDEIGNLSLNLQHKLLMAIQSRQITRLGSNKVIPVDVRLIAATNMPLFEMVEQGTFRQDLLYRINTIELELPPLKERVEDIPLLADHIIHEFREKYDKKNLVISPDATQLLKKHHWPGNIRELRHVLEKAIIMCDTDQLTSDDIFLKQRLDKFETDSFNLEENEKNIIRRALMKNGGNLKHTVNDLGISRKTLYNKMKKYGL